MMQFTYSTHFFHVVTYWYAPAYGAYPLKGCQLFASFFSTSNLLHMTEKKLEEIERTQQTVHRYHKPDAPTRETATATEIENNIPGCAGNGGWMLSRVALENKNDG
jgi:hypothetical protein